MTGYGRGESVRNGVKVTLELSSVNRKQTDISVNLPRNLEPLEARIRDEINRRIARGRLVVRIALHAAEADTAGTVRLNTALARAYLRDFQRLARELKLAEANVTLDLLLRAPGVLQTEEDVADAEDFWPAVQEALFQALATLCKMREREGAHLARDLRGRMAVIHKAVDRIQRRAPAVQNRYRDDLRERVKSAGLDLPGVDDERLLREVVYFADRSDISEELTRLQSHFQQFEDCLKANEPVGRTLDFLSQEMNREINTIGAKANDARLSREVVIVKAELERFREQAQNVE